MEDRQITVNKSHKIKSNFQETPTVQYMKRHDFKSTHSISLQSRPNPPCRRSYVLAVRDPITWLSRLTAIANDVLIAENDHGNKLEKLKLDMHLRFVGPWNQ
jgi:hypothetical protein